MGYDWSTPCTTLLVSVIEDVHVELQTEYWNMFIMLPPPPPSCLPATLHNQVSSPQKCTERCTDTHVLWSPAVFPLTGPPQQHSCVRPLVQHGGGEAHKSSSLSSVTLKLLLAFSKTFHLILGKVSVRGDRSFKPHLVTPGRHFVVVSFDTRLCATDHRTFKISWAPMFFFP